MTGPSLRLRITAWYAGLLATVLLIFGAFLYWSLARFLSHSLDRTLSDNAHNIARQFVSRAQVRGDGFIAHEVNETYAPKMSGWFIRIVRPDNTVLYQSAQTQWNSSAVPLPKLFSLGDHYSSFTVKGDRLALYAMHYQGYLIQVGRSSAHEQDSLDNLLLTLALLTPLTLLIAAFGGYLLMGLPLKPVTALTNQAERVGVQHMGERLPVIHTGDELERLSLSLNRMIARLEAALAHNQRFSADVSHELRTPLTIMRVEMEHVIQLSRLDTEALESIGSALEEIERMAKIIDNLLCISKFDSGESDITLQPVKLAELAINTVDQMSLLAEEKSIDLVCRRTPEITVTSDPVRLKQVLVNLLDNAIKYTPVAGNVTVSWQQMQRHALLIVEDTGQGIDPEELPCVFDRFYRTDKARSRTSGGAGLGLSIVRAVSTAIAAKVSLTSCLHEGTTARVEIPLWEDDQDTSETPDNWRELYDSIRD